MLALERATRIMWIYPMCAGGGFAPRRQAATGWQGTDLVGGVGDRIGIGWQIFDVIT